MLLLLLLLHMFTIRYTYICMYIRYDGTYALCTSPRRAIGFEARLVLRKPVLGEDCPDAVKGQAEYSLLATVSHHGKNAAGRALRLLWGALGSSFTPSSWAAA